MENFGQIFYTIISGTLVFVLGQILQNFVLNPVQQYKKIIGKIDNKLKYYFNILTNSGFDQALLKHVTNTIRKLSCELEANYKQIPCQKLMSKLKIIESRSDIAKVAQGLIFLSNAGGRSDRGIDRCEERINQIRNLLKIETLNA